MPIEPGADVFRIKIEQLLRDGRKGRQMETQRSLRGNADVSARNVAEQYRACREAGARNFYIHLLGLKFLPFIDIEENEAATVFGDFDRCGVGGGGEKR